MNQEIKYLNEIDWDFADYNSTLFPSDIHSIHWYPGSFVPQIPSVLIEVLSKPGDVVLDVFSGSGITIIEAAKLNRKFIGLDSNPVANEICKAKFYALSIQEQNWHRYHLKRILQLKEHSGPIMSCKKHGIDIEVLKWFHIKTLSELMAIYEYIISQKNDQIALILKIIFSSILNKCCSQREHYTYITDNCRPKKLIYRSAISTFIEQLELIGAATQTLREDFDRAYKHDWEPLLNGRIDIDDARLLETVLPNEADIVITSPPYLGVNDYVRSMKLTYMFFPNDKEKQAIGNEIGARRKRGRKFAYEEYIDDMRKVLYQITRVLKPGAYFCLVIGQGRGKVNKYDPIEALLKILTTEFNYSLVLEKQRSIKFRRIQVPGVGKENIFIFKN